MRRERERVCALDSVLSVEVGIVAEASADPPLFLLENRTAYRLFRRDSGRASAPYLCAYFAWDKITSCGFEHLIFMNTCDFTWRCGLG